MNFGGLFTDGSKLWGHRSSDRFDVVVRKLFGDDFAEPGGLFLPPNMTSADINWVAALTTPAEPRGGEHALPELVFQNVDYRRSDIMQADEVRKELIEAVYRTPFSHGS